VSTLAMFTTKKKPDGGAVPSGFSEEERVSFLPIWSKQPTCQPETTLREYSKKLVMPTCWTMCRRSPSRSIPAAQPGNHDILTHFPTQSRQIPPRGGFRRSGPTAGLDRWPPAAYEARRSVRPLPDRFLPHFSENRTVQRPVRSVPPGGGISLVPKLQHPPFPCSQAPASPFPLFPSSSLGTQLCRSSSFGSHEAAIHANPLQNP